MRLSLATRPTRLRAVLLVASTAVAVSCGHTGGDDTPADTATPLADRPGMAGVAMPDSAKKTPNEVTFTAAQIAHGKVAWTPAAESTVPNVVEVPGQLVPNEDRTTRLASPGEGRIVSVPVSPGDRVAEGATLVSLQSPQAGMAQADVAKAQAELTARQSAATYARTARERADRLLTLKAIPRQDYERAVADDDAARAALTQAQAEFDRARSVTRQLGADAPSASGLMVIRSPIAGVVIARDAAPGMVVSAGSPLVTVSDVSTLWLTAAATEQIAVSLRAGARVRFSAGALPDTLTADVQSIAGAFDPATRSLPIRALVSNAAGRLRPEMYAKVWMPSGQTRAVTIADQAIQRLDQKNVVFVAHPDGKGGARFERREITVGGSSGGRTAIAAGLTVGELVVSAGAYAVTSEFAKAKMGKMEMD